MKPLNVARSRDPGERESHGSSGIVDFVRVRAARLARDVRAVLVSFAGYGASEADEDSQEQGTDAEVVTPLGFVSRPKPSDNTRSTLEAVVIRDGDDSVIIALVDKSLAKLTDSTLAPGEVAIHGACADNIATSVRISANGDVTITTKSGSKVVVNGGSAPVAHEGSATTGHQHVLTGTAGPFAIAGTAQTATDTVAVGAGSSDVLVRNT